MGVLGLFSGWKKWKEVYTWLCMYTQRSKNEIHYFSIYRTNKMLTSLSTCTKQYQNLFVLRQNSSIRQNLFNHSS
uniref:Putative ovule protein n=1 Tax=Solanum chacoense TaxID=4108 RepID=A0A0V0GLR2_SOLCH